MSSSTTNQYIRQVIHHQETPPPVQARFFYTSPLAIDDPLSPLPPPAVAGATVSRAPHPFSEYDNTALDKAWHDLRRKILQYNEQHGEKSHVSEEQEEIKRQEKGKGTELGRVSTSKVPNRPASRSDASGRERRSANAFKEQHQQRGTGTQLSSSLGAAADLMTDMKKKASFGSLDGPALGPEVEVPDVTGTPFIRAPSRRFLQPAAATASRRDRSSSRNRPHPHAVDSYKWDDERGLPDIETQDQKRREINAQGPSMKVAVGISRLHDVAMPELQCVASE